MNACASSYTQSPAVSIQLEKRDGSELFGTGCGGGLYSLACAAGWDERAWMKRGSHARPQRKQGNPSCGPNKTAAILKSTNETRTSHAQQEWLRTLFIVASERISLMLINREDVIR
jgi:hypothetical protein